MAKQCRAVCAATKGINFAVGRGHAFRNNLPIALGMGKGKDFEIFVNGLNVASNIEQKGNYVLGVGCVPHSCGINMSAFAIDIRHGNLITILLQNGKLAWVIKILRDLMVFTFFLPFNDALTVLRYGKVIDETCEICNATIDE